MEIFIVGVIAIVLAGYFIAKNFRQKEKDLQTKENRFRDHQEKETKRLKHEYDALLEARKRSEHLQDSYKAELSRLLNEAHDLKTAFENGYIKGRKWLADAYSEYINLRDLELETALVVKSNPAETSAERVAELRRQRTEMAKELKLAEYQLKTYEEYFPELLDYREAILDEVADFRLTSPSELSDAENEVDSAVLHGYITKKEYEELPTEVRFQKALDNYWSRPKSNVHIGRVYERYIGYLYEKDGWKVRYVGALLGLEDFGRDLICIKGQTTKIVQCKCWSVKKQIREKHIFQLFGTGLLYRLRNEREKKQKSIITFGNAVVDPVFATTTNLSEDAQMVANDLNVEILRKPLERYPMIKCNVNHATGELIYHFPFDQQYDKIVVGDKPKECYVNTVAEAEAAGFRRAYRWGGEVES